MGSSKVSGLSGIADTTDDSVIMVSYTTDNGTTYESKKIRMIDLIDDFEVGDLADVDGTVTPAADQVLTWSDVTAKWVPAAPSAAADTLNAAQYKFQTSTTAGPSNGHFRLNSGVYSSATQLYISDLTSNNVDISGPILNLIKSGMQVYIQDRGDSSKAALYDITTDPLDNGSYTTIAISHIASSGSVPGNNSNCLIVFRGEPGEVVESVNGQSGIVTGIAEINTTQTFTKAQRFSVGALTSGASITPDFATNNNFSIALAANCTLQNPSNLTAGQSGAIVITQTGGTFTMAFGTNWKFESGVAPTLTATNGAVDVLVYYVESGSRITAKLLLDVK